MGLPAGPKSLAHPVLRAAATLSEGLVGWPARGVQSDLAQVGSLHLLTPLVTLEMLLAEKSKWPLGKKKKTNPPNHHFVRKEGVYLTDTCHISTCTIYM